MSGTFLHRLESWSQSSPDSPAQAWKSGSEWKTLSARQLHDNVEALSRYLHSIGFSGQDIGLIFSYNCPQWTQMDLAFMLAGGSSAGIYVNASERQIHYILKHSEAKILVVDRPEALQKIFADKNPQEIAPGFVKAIVISEDGELPAYAIRFSQALAAGRQVAGRSFGESLTNCKPESRAILIYTSGTTGLPKAVSLSHANIAFAAESYRATWDPPQYGRLYSFLPLAHIAERIASTGISLTNRYAVHFCSDLMSIASEMREVQPAISLCVPRLWDKLKEGAEKKIARMPDRRRNLVNWAMRTSRDFQNRVTNKKPVSLGLRLKHAFAERLVLREMRKQLGLGNAARSVSGAASLAPSTLDWYRGIGVRLIEGYALSETSGVLTCGIDSVGIDTAYTVGVPYPKVEIRLAEDGEIETRGPHIFQGYFKDQAATDEMLKDGWLRTGDLGAFNEAGYLRILGRKREIIKNGEGKMISPLFLESLLLASPLIDQAIVIGNEKPYLVALLSMPEELRHKYQDPQITQQIQEQINKINRDVASHERIKAFRLIPQPFAIEREEMTATMKLRRMVIEANYKDLIQSMY